MQPKTLDFISHLTMRAGMMVVLMGRAGQGENCVTMTTSTTPCKRYWKNSSDIPSPSLMSFQSYSQSQARLMFVTTLGMDNFDCTKMNAHFKKFIRCLREGLIHEWKQPLLAPPLPLMSLNNSRLCSTHNHSSISFLSTGPRSPTRLGIRSQDLGLPNEYSLGHCGLSAASRHKLAFTSRHYALLTATDTTALY